MQKSRKSRFYTSILYLLLALLIEAVLLVFGKSILESKNRLDIRESLSYFIDIQFNKLDLASNEIENSIDREGHISWGALNEIAQISGVFSAISNDSVWQYWNIQHTSLGFPPISNSQGDTIVQLNNGFYLVHLNITDSLKIYTFSLLSNHYKVKNDLLLNEQTSLEHIAGTFTTTEQKSKGLSDAIRLSKNNVYDLFFIPSPDFIVSENTQAVFLLLHLLAYALLVLYLAKVILFNVAQEKLAKNRFLLFLASVFLIRIIDQYFNITQSILLIPVLKQTFSETLALDTLLNIITNTFILFLALVVLKKVIRSKGSTISPGYSKTILFVFIVVYFAVGAHLNNEIFLNNNISISPFNLLELPSSWPFYCYLFLFSCGLFVSLSIFFDIKAHHLSKAFTITSFAIVGSLCLLHLIITGTFFVLLGFAITTLIFALSSINSINRSGITQTIILLLILSSMSWLLNQLAINYKEKEMQKFTAIMLSQKREPLLEHNFNKLLTKLSQDKILSASDSIYDQENLNETIQYIQHRYLDSAFKVNDIQITICDSTDFLDIPGEEDLISCNTYFRELIKFSGKQIIDSTLYLINTSTENIYYLGVFKIPGEFTSKTIYFEFVSSYAPEGLGYPELLIDKQFQAYSLTNTSYARYYGETLGYKFGDFKYPILLSQGNFSAFKEGYFSYNMFHHYAITTSGQETIIVSVPKKSVSMLLFPFSMFFLIYLFATGLAYLIYFSIKKTSPFSITLKTKLQVFTIATIIITTILLATVTLVFMQSNTRENTKKQLEEKTYSVYIELQHKLGDRIEFTTEESKLLQELLKKFSLVFFSDINLYEPSGKLVATSRPEMEQKGLLSNMVNPHAYKALIIDHQLSFITIEKIGKMPYFSAYLPLYLSGNQPAAIINLPYFARQTEINKSFSILLANFINLAVIFGFLGIIISIIISKVITRPLSLLQLKMSEIEIEKPNEPILWPNKDEIGTLIEQYNKMVEKLELSATLIKDSEREKTWREMARQVAHEIKNPLTPMKLNVQYLEKAYREKQPDFDTKLATTTQSLIDQIETLNNVADMFSEMATFQNKTYAPVDLVKLLKGVSELFTHHTEIKFITNLPTIPCMINVVEKDIIRMLNNLLKNAVQSFTNQKEKLIKIDCHRSEGQVILTISDTGKGMSDQVQANIFKPYFTTKSSGTGLGLAIVKSIVNENNGEIEFRSMTGKGTTFTLRFPLLKL
jgi:signal transduction histidine kinase